MKKITIITIVALVLITIAYFIQKNITKGLIQPPCAKEGEITTGARPPGSVTIECCPGLSGIIQGDGNDGCAIIPGSGLVCSKCGNKVCEEWENSCNCPNDCK